MALRTSSHGDVALVVGLLLALSVPTSRVLSRRVLLAGSIFFGYVPILWWTRLPLGPLGRPGLLVAALAGGLVAWVTAGGRTDLGRRARTLVPQVAVVDLIPPLVAGASALVVSGWFRIRTAPSALTALLGGWDNSAHLDMVGMVLRYGTTVDRLGPAPLGESWKFADYPQGYHAVLATLIQALQPAAQSDADALLVTFVHAEAWIVVILAAMLAAAVCAQPRLRRRPLSALVAATALVAGFVTGPGSQTFTDGFPNFVLACALVACVPLLVATMPKVFMPLQIAALGGLVAAVASCWVLLLAIALPAAAVVGIPATRARWRGSPRQRAVTIALLALVASVVVVQLSILARLHPGDVLVTRGAISSADTVDVVVVALVSAALLLQRWAPPRLPVWSRHAAAPLAGIVTAGALAGWQLHSAGRLSYYFYKLLIAVDLTSLSVLALALVALLPTPESGRSGRERDHVRRRLLRAVGLLAAVLAATQVTGFTWVAPRLFAAPASDSPAAVAIVASSTRTGPAARATLLLPDRFGVSGLEAQQWYLSLSGRWTDQANDSATRTLLTGGDADDKAVKLLDEHGDAIVVVDPAVVDTVRRSVGSAERQARVVGW